MERDTANLPFPANLLAKRVNRVCQTLLSLTALMERKLESYNKTNRTFPHPGVYQKTEGELWSSRAKSYDYWM